MISMDKKYRTRDGEDVVLYCVDAPGDYPVHGRIFGRNYPSTWMLDGRAPCGEGIDDDLVEVKEKKVVYLNVYMGGYEATSSIAHRTRAAAEGLAGPNRIACVRVEYEDGQFDE